MGINQQFTARRLNSIGIQADLSLFADWFIYICAMPVYQLDPYYMAFPPPDHANDDGLLAVGGMLREDWLLLAYQQGIFPWFNEGEPVMWWSPDPRFALRPDEVKIAKSMRPLLNQQVFEFSLDRDFDSVIDRCAEIPRHGQNGTWITTHMKKAYKDLHKTGMAHSAEVWQKGELVGGLYGVSIGAAFFGESMFSDVPNASKFAFIKLCQWLDLRQYTLIDCQIYSRHMEKMGARQMSRAEFLDHLEDAIEEETLRGPWLV